MPDGDRPSWWRRANVIPLVVFLSIVAAIGVQVLLAVAWP